MREDWVDIELATVCAKVEKVKRKDMPLSGKLKYLDIGGIDNTTNRIVSHKDFTWQDAPSRAQQIVKKGDVLFSTVRTYLKNIALVRKDEYNDEICSSGFTVLRGKTNVLDSNYLFYLSLSVGFLNPLNKLQTGTSYPAVRDKDVFAKIIPLAPFLEQRAIVAKIEGLFSDLDKGIADLKKAQAQLVVYRQAVLKKGFEGKLTKEWREKQTNLPSAEELFDQIKEERERHYTQQLEDWKKAVKDWEGNGKKGKKPGKPSRLKEFSISNEILDELPVLQFGFSWLALGNLFIESPQNGLYKPASDYGSGTDIIRIDNFYEGKISVSSDFKKVRLSDNEKGKYLLRNDQILINRVNSIEYLGKSGLVAKLNQPTVFESNIMRLSILKSKILPKYLTHFLTSVIGISEIRRFAKHAVNQASINQTDVSLTPVPVCSLPEQLQIVQEIESRLSVCNQVEQSITESLKKAQALRQSILKKAFEGALLSEGEIAQCKKEKDYEPASILLERIRAEKEKKQITI